MAGNEALDINPPNANLNISRAGSDWLWAVFSLMGLSLLVAIALDWLVCDSLNHSSYLNPTDYMRHDRGLVVPVSSIKLQLSF